MSEVILEWDDLVRRVADLRSKGQKMVFVEGCFDLLHVGHVRHLRHAKEQGDVLLVALRSDDSIRSLKGPRRPLMPLEDRMGVLSSFEMVDLVTVLAEESSRRLLDALQPDVVVKAEEAGDHSIEGLIQEIARRYGPKTAGR